MKLTSLFLYKGSLPQLNQQQQPTFFLGVERVFARLFAGYWYFFVPAYS